MDPALFSDLLLPRYKQHNAIPPEGINRVLQSQLFSVQSESELTSTWSCFGITSRSSLTCFQAAKDASLKHKIYEMALFGLNHIITEQFLANTWHMDLWVVRSVSPTHLAINNYQVKSHSHTDFIAAPLSLTFLLFSTGLHNYIMT